MYRPLLAAGLFLAGCSGPPIKRSCQLQGECSGASEHQIADCKYNVRDYRDGNCWTELNTAARCANRHAVCASGDWVVPEGKCEQEQAALAGCTK